MNYQTLSSQVQFSILDELLYECLSSLLETTNFVQACISDLINFQYYNKKRDISTKYKWEEAISYCLIFLQKPTIDNLKLCSLDRGYTLPIIIDFINKTKKYPKYTAKSFAFKKKRYTKYAHKLKHIENKVHAKQDIYQVVLNTKYIFDIICEHKACMIEAYKLYYMKVAHNGARCIDLPIDVEELIQNFYFATSKAIDHYDLSKGAFKSYLDTWLKKMLHGGNHFYGSAYDTKGNKNLNHLYMPLDELNHHTPTTEAKLISDNEQEILTKIIKLLDPNNITKLIDI